MSSQDVFIKCVFAALGNTPAQSHKHQDKAEIVFPILTYDYRKASGKRGCFVFPRSLWKLLTFLFSHSITSHVQVNNEDALQFYRKFDFHSVETKEQYYKRIDPPHAHVLQKDLKPPPAEEGSGMDITDPNSID